VSSPEAPHPKRKKRPPATQVRALRSKAAGEIGRRLLALREEISGKRGEKVTLAEVCAAVRAMTPQLSDYETGKKIPGAVMLDRLAEFYQVSIDFLVREPEGERARAAAAGDRKLVEMVALLEKLTPEQFAMIRMTVESFVKTNERSA
jgi:transcriptional regulator with XRE-family HTH domain